MEEPIVATDALDIPGVREMSWTKAGARMAGGDKEFDRLVPSSIFVEDGMVPRSHAVLESVVQSMEAVGQLVPVIVAAEGNVLLDGATRLEAAKRLLPLRRAPVDAALAERAVAHARAHAASFGDVVAALPVSREAGLAVVWRLIARGTLVVDLTMPVTTETRVTTP
jgi:hypothetical protein